MHAYCLMFHSHFAQCVSSSSTVCALSLAASLRDDSPRKSNVKLAEMRLEAAAVS